jgi:hypothetical protein
MTQKIVRTPPEDVVSGEPVSYYGFGLQTQDLFSRQAIGHSGSMFVATCGMRFIPEEGVGVVVHANGSGYPPITMADYALARMLGEEPLSVPSIRIEKILEELTGHYDTYRGTYSCTVRKKGDYLMLEYSSNYGTDSTVLVPVELGPEHSRFHVYMSGRRHTAEFFHRGEHVELLNERYKYRRVGRLT